jgi:glutamyl-tRNA synthetase
MEALGDFPVTQKSGSPSYQLAVVVDDLMMGITEVVRGNDLIASTFRQLQIFEALSAKGPTYAHVPLVLGGDGRRLAKRHGDTRLATLREQGVKPHHVITWAARSAGLVPEHTTLQSAEELISRFQWSNLSQQEVVVCPETFGDS